MEIARGKTTGWKKPLSAKKIYWRQFWEKGQ